MDQALNKVQSPVMLDTVYHYHNNLESTLLYGFSNSESRSLSYVIGLAKIYRIIKM
jgi:hypothetical protein